MRAVRLVHLGQPLADAEVPVPEIGPSDVLVRVGACGICHSDGHYRAGISRINALPVTLGHEIAGRVEAVGDKIHHVSAGDRVYVHYLVSCGHCDFCVRGNEQFCVNVQMIGKHRDGGYAESIKVPGQNVFPLPNEISFEEGAVMMCSSATALHALNKVRLQSGDTVAIFGFGGLGFSALQLAKAFGCGKAYVVDINSGKRTIAASLGAIAIDPAVGDPVDQIQEANGGKGVDVSIELVGSAVTMGQAVRCLEVLGRAAFIGLTAEPTSFLPYPDLINKEAQIIGVSDHLATELPALMQLARNGKLCFPPGTLESTSLDAAQINVALDALDRSTGPIRTVIVPQT
jgi:2-desacetyl-2-hydroxyethyl bacteriochlorophyllide A dehydrogenase